MILGRTREASEEVWEDAEAVCSLRMVVLCAMQALVGQLVCVFPWLITDSHLLEERRWRRR